MNVELLKWIIGMNENYVLDNEDDIYEHIIKHRVEARFLSRARQVRVKENASITTLNEHYHHINNRVESHLKLIKELNRRIDNQNIKATVIKGISVYLLLGSKNKIRFSGDIDIVTNDIEKLKNELLKMGFEKLESSVDKHEDSTFKKGDVYIDLHKSFPIITPPTFNDIPKKQTFTKLLDVVYIASDDILENSMILTHESECVRVLNREFAVLIACLHITKDHLWEPYKRLRIAEFLEVLDLISLPDFSITEFLKLVNKYNASYHVGFVFSFLKNELNSTLDILDQYPQPQCIIKLMNDTLGPYLISQSKTFYSDLLFQSFEDKVRSMFPVRIKTNNDYVMSDEEKLYIASTSDIVPNFEIKLLYKDNNLNVIMKIDRALMKGDNFFVRFADTFTHLWIDDSNGTTRVYGNTNVTVSNSSVKSKVEFNIGENYSTYMVSAFGCSDDYSHSVSVMPIEILFA